ncbi:MAG: pyrroline-5-carboxylate reductase [Gammaproteobacteria bacterium]
MTSATIAIIGGGHMGTSLLAGLIANHYASDKLWVADPETKKLLHLKTEFNIQTTTDNLVALQSADIVILAVKPQLLAKVCAQMQEIIHQKQPLVISIAAGVRVDSIQKWLGGKTAIVRAMPNTPAMISCGATALFANKFVSANHHDLAESILRAVGVCEWVNDETLMDTVTALSGSGPAYFFLMIEALQNAAQELGLPAETARLLTLQTAFGAARMALESEFEVTELRKRVTSPGGTTEQAVRILEEKKIREMFKQALIAAKTRAEELGDLLDKT